VYCHVMKCYVAVLVTLAFSPFHSHALNLYAKDFATISVVYSIFTSYEYALLLLVIMLVRMHEHEMN
jgi:uncharacterized membrane protein